MSSDLVSSLTDFNRWSRNFILYSAMPIVVLAVSNHSINETGKMVSLCNKSTESALNTTIFGTKRRIALVQTLKAKAQQIDRLIVSFARGATKNYPAGDRVVRTKSPLAERDTDSESHSGTFYKSKGWDM